MTRPFVLTLICLSALASAEDRKVIDVTVAHSFSKAEAKERLGYLLKYWDDRFSVKNAWTDDTVAVSGRVYGISIRATFSVTDTQVSAVAQDPGFFWRSRTKSYVEKKMKKYLHPQYLEP
jgi:hypothetical protein